MSNGNSAKRGTQVQVRESPRFSAQATWNQYEERHTWNCPETEAYEQLQPWYVSHHLRWWEQMSQILCGLLSHWCYRYYHFNYYSLNDRIKASKFQLPAITFSSRLLSGPIIRDVSERWEFYNGAVYLRVFPDFQAFSLPRKFHHKLLSY